MKSAMFPVFPVDCPSWEQLRLVQRLQAGRCVAETISAISPQGEEEDVDDDEEEEEDDEEKEREEEEDKEQEEGRLVAVPQDVWHPVALWLLGFSNVTGSVTQLLGQLVNHILENYRVNILSKKVEEEPVTHVALANNGVNAFFLHPPVAKAEDKGPDVGTEDDDNPVDYDDTAQEAQE